MFDSGITTLNLAISGKPDEFAMSGNTVSYVGQSNSGKTVMMLTTLAASFYSGACSTPVVYPMEPGVLIDIEKLYGKKFFKALVFVDIHGMNLEQWQADVRGRYAAAKKPLGVGLDSTDATKCAADLAGIDGKQKAKKKGATEEEDEDEGVNMGALGKKGMKVKMGGEAAAAWSRCLGEVTKAVNANKGLLILTSQLRTKPGVMFGSPFYRSCGAALDFYSDIRVWFWNSTREVIDDVNVGGWTKFEVQRNRVTGDARTIYAPIYPSYGVDDTRAMLHFLADTASGAAWACAKGMGSITVGGEVVEGKLVGGQTMTLAEMAAFYEGEGTKDVLKRMVTEAWNAREAKLKHALLADRKPRFGK